MPHKTLTRRTVRIAPYDDNWPNESAELGAALRQALSAPVLLIDDCGSTAVPALTARDLIYMQLTVGAQASESRETLTAIGYMQRSYSADRIPPGEGGAPGVWANWPVILPPVRRATNEHVCIAHLPGRRPPLLVDDFLSSNEIARGAYEWGKVVLAPDPPETIDAQSAVKDPRCDVMFEGAEAGADATIGPPPSSDA